MRGNDEEVLSIDRVHCTIGVAVFSDMVTGIYQSPNRLLAYLSCRNQLHLETRYESFYLALLKESAFSILRFLRKFFDASMVSVSAAYGCRERDMIFLQLFLWSSA